MDDDIKKIRGNLMWISSTIILYWLAGGNLADSDNHVKIGTVTFSEPKYIAIAGIIIYVYLLNRFRINAKKLSNELITDIFKRLASNKDYIDCVMSSKPLSEAGYNKQQDKEKWSKNQFGYVNQLAYNDVKTPPLPLGIVRTLIIYNRQVGQLPEQWKESIDGTDSKQSVFELTFKESLLVKKYWFKALRESIRDSNEFYQLVIPYVLAFTAYAVLVALSWDYFCSFFL